jgi:hypothetical protein
MLPQVFDHLSAFRTADLGLIVTSTLMVDVLSTRRESFVTNVTPDVAAVASDACNRIWLSQKFGELICVPRQVTEGHFFKKKIRSRV